MQTAWNSTIVVAPGQSIADAQPGRPLNLSLENPSTDLNDPAVYDLLTDGRESSSGIVVNHRKALLVPAIWQALSQISGDVAKLPLDLFQKLPDDDRRKADDHPTHWLVRRKPNREMGAFKFWRRMMVALLFWNNAYALIVRRGNGTPVELLPLLPDRTAPERHGGQLVYVTEVEGQLHPFYPDEIFHLEGISCDGLAGFEWIKAARDTVGSALAALKMASHFYKNGGRVGGILELPAAMPKPTKDKVEEGFRRMYETSEAFKTIVLRENAKFHEAQQSLRDSQMVEGRRESVRDIARYFNLRPSRLGEESTVSYASKSEDNRDYYDTTLSHHLVGIQSEAFDKLLTAEEQRGGYYFEHNVAALLQMDFKSVMESLTAGVSSLILSPNEARRILNMNKRADGKGDEYVNPNTTSGKKNSDSAPGSSNRLLSAHRKLVAEGLARIVGALAGKIEGAVKSPDDAAHWIAAKLDDWRSSFARSIAAAVEAHASTRPCHIESTVAIIVDGAISGVRVAVTEAVAAAAGLPQPAGIKAAIRDALKQFQAEQCPQLAAILSQETQSDETNESV